MTYQITEKVLRDIVRECVSRTIKNKNSNLDEVFDSTLRRYKKNIFEMAFKRKEYKDRVEDLAPQIIENIALIRHCSIYNETNNKRHWSLKLRGHLLTVSRFNLKGSNNWEDKESAIREVWEDNDFFLPRTIELTINNKFTREKFDTYSESFLQVISDTINTFNTLIHVICTGEIEDIDNFIAEVKR